MINDFISFIVNSLHSSCVHCSFSTFDIKFVFRHFISYFSNVYCLQISLQYVVILFKFLISQQKLLVVGEC